MYFLTVVFLFASSAATSAFPPIEEFHIPKPYAFGYQIKDKHGEQHRKEIGDGVHNVKGSYGFKDDRGIERLVNYVADKGGFRAEIKTNEPGTASLNPAAVKMESSAHPYFGTSNKAVATVGKAKAGLAIANKFGFPAILKFGTADISKEGLAFDTEIAKENELEKESLSEEFAKGYGLTKEPLGFPSIFVEDIVKEDELVKFLEELSKEETALSSEKDTDIEKERLELAKMLIFEELAKQGIIYSPMFTEGTSPELKESGLEKEELAFDNNAEAFPLALKFSKAPLPFYTMKPTGFAYGGPLLGGFVKGYDARFY